MKPGTKNENMPLGRHEETQEGTGSGEEHGGITQVCNTGRSIGKRAGNQTVGGNGKHNSRQKGKTSQRNRKSYRCVLK